MSFAKVILCYLEEITEVEVGYIRLPYRAWNKNFKEELNMIPVLRTFP